MSFLITALTRSHTINKTTGEKNKQQNKRKNYCKKLLVTTSKYYQEKRYLQTSFFVTTKQMGLYAEETR